MVRQFSFICLCPFTGHLLYFKQISKKKIKVNRQLYGLIFIADCDSGTVQTDKTVRRKKRTSYYDKCSFDCCKGASGVKLFCNFVVQVFKLFS